MSTSSAHNSKHAYRIRRLAALALLASGLAAAYLFVTRPNAEELKRQARAALEREDYETAADLAETALAGDPGDSEAALLAGDAHFALKHYERALEYFQRECPREATRSSERQVKAGRVLMYHLGRAADAEACFRNALKQDPDRQDARYELALLLGVLARERDAAPHILKLLRDGKVNVDLLTLLGSESGRIQRDDLFAAYRRNTPGDPSVILVRAWEARNSHVRPRPHVARRLLADGVQQYPDFPPLRHALVEVLWEQQRIAELQPQLRACFDHSDVPPALWNIRGQLAERRGNRRGAARCYWEAFQRDPTSPSAVLHLSRVASRLEFSDAAKRLNRRLVALQTLRQAADVLLNSEHSSLEPLRKMVAAQERVGRLWEAWGWCRVAASIDPQAGWPKTSAAVLRAKLAECPESQVCGSTSAIAVDFSREPLPDWGRPSRTQPTPAKSLPHITFRDDAQKAGIRFRYFNSPHERNRGQRMFEFSGGGCAVLDYDRDGWPDLHFTQGCRWPVQDGRLDHLDRLYRNLGTGQFEDVTTQAGIVENRFSGGAAAGDYDNDGFADLYVANIGRNRLFRNNGDGTFDDVAEHAGVADDRWSTSCLVADLNGDGLPDVYSVNYLAGPDVFDRICRHDDGRPRMCMPFHFPGAQDQVFLNLGNGRFRNVTAGAGTIVKDGKGLGIAAADLCGRGKLDLFVANDTVMNSLFENRTEPPGGPLKFVESGLARGVALNRSGRAEGCMGIAVGDVDGDGRQDLFVTNFHLETNTLYLQRNPGEFADRTRESGLAQHSLQMLGFGTQFLDADLDGWLDVIVTNGHIDDLRPYGRPYQMPTQFFVNRGRGRFAELPAKSLGPFFQQKGLGRGLAKLDWDRDGREDAVLSFLDRPAALLTNTTTHVGNALRLALSGVTSARDAVGVTVRATVGDRVFMRQLTGGDGYQACNQRRLVIGLGAAEQVDRLDVQWPSGQRQVFQRVLVNQEVLLIEGSSRLFPLPDSRRDPDLKKDEG